MLKAKIRPNYIWAGAIAILVFGWLLSGQLFSGGTKLAESVSDAADAANPAPRVRVATLNATERSATMTVRGRTEALRKVEIRAEIAGVVEDLPVQRGDVVAEGDVLCQLKVNAREAQLAQAQAAVRQRGLEYEAARKLEKGGFRSETQKAGAAAAFEAAKADAKRMEIELENTKIRAPFAGVVDNRFVEVGDFMRVGDPCALVMGREPFLIVGLVSEREVNHIALGSPSTAVLITGEAVEGKIRFIAKRADEATRTFRVEVEVPNPAGDLRDGVTADIRIPVKTVKAHKISPAILVLDDKGAIGVRTIVDGKVAFKQVTIIADGADGTWVTGLPERVSVITVGQQYVTEGQAVEAVEERAEARS